MKIKITENVYWNPLVLLKNLLLLMLIVVIVWSAISYGEILATNVDIHTTNYPELSTWNFWRILGGM